MSLPAPVTTVLAFLCALGILVFVHELGHFLAAKRLNVKVLRFSIGFGPVIWSRTSGETEYALSIAPLGGYVKMLGEDDLEEAAAEPERSFSTQSRLRRAFIVLAGPAMNFLFAFLAYAVMFNWIGVEMPSTRPIVGGLQSGSAADKAGLQVDDMVKTVNGQAVETWEAFARSVLDSGGKMLTLQLDRAGKPVTLQVTPELKDTHTIFGEPESVFRIGVEAGKEWRQDVGTVEAVELAAQQTWGASMVVAKGLFLMVQGKVPLRELGGPIAIARAAGQQARAGARHFFSMLAFLSINLGVLNLLPIPALDGGHLALLSVEGALRRSLAPRAREIAQQVGVFLLLTLMVFVFYNDIHRLVQG